MGSVQHQISSTQSHKRAKGARSHPVQILSRLIRQIHTFSVASLLENQVWVLQFSSETKHQSMNYRTKSSPNHKLFQCNPLEAKCQIDKKKIYAGFHTLRRDIYWKRHQKKKTLNKEMKTRMGRYYGKCFSIGRNEDFILSILV